MGQDDPWEEARGCLTGILVIIGGLAVVGVTYTAIRDINAKGLNGWLNQGVEGWVFLVQVATVLGALVLVPVFLATLWEIRRRKLRDRRKTAELMQKVQRRLERDDADTRPPGG